ncbi:unnamed protein product [Enterobius vermicularis]|uniref:ATG16 domain-containing protein n=1 Tax=Enterobius vermicularis TaxID=51028 RepID=A0A0N4V0S6_ENTVE|nr:unnamed protein product [Enterobius vermicularis]
MDGDFRAIILERLKSRNEVCDQFSPLFAAYNELTDYVAQLGSRGRLRSSSVNGGGNETDSKLREELSELYRKKEQNDQQLIETNNRLENLQKKFEELQAKHDATLAELEEVRKKLKALKEENNTLFDSNRILRDEHLALQVTYDNLAQRTQVVEQENLKLIENLKEAKNEQIKLLNEQNEREERERDRMRQAEIISSISNSPPSSDEK